MIATAKYCQNVKLEGQAIRMISDQYIIPAVVRYLNELKGLGEHAPATASRSSFLPIFAKLPSS